MTIAQVLRTYTWSVPNGTLPVPSVSCTEEPDSLGHASGYQPKLHYDACYAEAGRVRYSPRWQGVGLWASPDCQPASHAAIVASRPAHLRLHSSTIKHLQSFWAGASLLLSPCFSTLPLLVGCNGPFSYCLSLPFHCSISIFNPLSHHPLPPDCPRVRFVVRVPGWRRRSLQPVRQRDCRLPYPRCRSLERHWSCLWHEWHLQRLYLHPARG